MLTLHKKNAYKRYHMKAIFFLLLFPLCSVAQSTTQYLVTKSNDTIHYKGDLIVNNNDITKWRRITADGTEYSISEIKAAYFNHNYYYNCDSRHLYKQVVKGKINVYALNDRDTITDRHGNLRKEVFIEKTYSGVNCFIEFRTINITNDVDAVFKPKCKRIIKDEHVAFELENQQQHGGFVLCRLLEDALRIHDRPEMFDND